MTEHSHRDKHKIIVEPESPKQEGAAEAAAALEEQLARLQAEKEELAQTLIRRQADFENYRKRIERERQEDQRRGVGRVIAEVLPVLDALERAIKVYGDSQHSEVRKGLELIYRQMWDLLARHGLERIAAAGNIFDPHFHQAIERVETTKHPDGTVLEVVQDGYLYHGSVLRPSAVRVAAHAGERASAVDRSDA